MLLGLQKHLEKVKKNYDLNDEGHGRHHVEYVIRRSLKFAQQVPAADKDIVVVIATYHDCMHHVNKDLHEELSAQYLRDDPKLKEYFDLETIEMMAQAVEDHRSSLEGEPRSIYGKIVSSADRDVSIENSLRRMYLYRLKHFPQYNLQESADDAYEHAKFRWGKDGMSVGKIYYEDDEYDKFITDMDRLLKKKKEFDRQYFKVAKLKRS